ncbi:MAG: hypothetical protein V4548_01795 [Bacteroidota bacterium]
MKNLILILTLFTILNSKAQSIEKSLFNVIDVFIENEIIAKNKDKDSILLDVSFFKAEKDYIINLDIYRLDFKRLKSIDTIYSYKGIKAMVFLNRLSIDMKKQISDNFEIFEKDNIKKSTEKYGVEDYNDGYTTYCPFSSIIIQFNNKNKIYIIYSSNDKQYYKLLKDKVEFAKKVKFSPRPSYK